MKDGRGLTIAAVIGLGLWAWTRAKPAAAYPLNLLPAEKQPERIPTAPAPEIAPVVKTAAEFSATYGMSEKAAIETALRYAANPSSEEFATLTTRDKQNLANIDAEAQARQEEPSTAEAQVTALIGSQPTASIQELNIVEQTYGRESEAYQAVIDTAFEAAQSQAQATGGVVSWSSEGGYQAISLEEAAGPEYWDYY